IAGIDRRLVVAGLILVAATGLFYAARWVHAGRPLSFLVWNLFLAAIPVVAAFSARHFARRIWFWPLILLWLVFLPNAPYIVTDLMHIRTTRPANLWLDVLLLGSAALTGLFAGLVALRWAHEAVARRFTSRLGWALVIAASLLCGFGVYLGRFQRWNSWDIVTRPTELLAEAWSALAETHVLAFSVLFSVVLFAGYAVLTVIVGRPANPRATRVAPLSADTSP
ncbi:MAG TPA: DUF1361 domain-containing protein, partial [Myxococcota bacterium]|nr:DUF1361 domain-containing protein [Myxococcota bacterium]